MPSKYVNLLNVKLTPTNIALILGISRARVSQLRLTLKLKPKRDASGRVEYTTAQLELMKARCTKSGPQGPRTNGRKTK